ncbi:MAG: T9SS type A sorting domain-containing protein [Chitinophagales bacterium]
MLRKFLILQFIIGISPVVHAQFVKEFYGIAGTVSSFQAIAPVDGTAGSDLYISGSISSSVFVGQFAQNGEAIWLKSISVGDTGYVVNSMIVDSDGKLVMCGTNYVTGDINDDYSFVIKFDPVAKTVIWWKKTQAPVALFDCAEIGAGGDYVVAGQELGLGDGDGSDHITLKMDRNTGTFTTISNLNANANETVHAVLVEQSSHDIYTAGRYEVSGGTTKFRICLDRISGPPYTVNWTRYYINDLLTSGRFYPQDILQDGDALLIAGSGDDAGTASYKNLYLLKLDLDGNVIWIKKYDITGADNDGLFSNIKKCADGYILSGTLYDGAQTNAFLFKIDISGNVQWARSYPYAIHSSLGLKMSGSLAVVGDHAFHVGELKTGDGSVHGILAKVDVSTGYVGQCYTELEVNTIDKPSIQNDAVMEADNAVVTAESPGIISSTVELSTEFSCLGTSAEDIIPDMHAGIELFPNPSGGLINIRVPQTEDQLYLEIYNMEGQIVLEDIFKREWLPLDISNLVLGSYMCIIKASENKVVARIPFQKM